MPKPSTLLVASNPYCVLDADGEPHGAVQRTDKGSGRRLIGASLDRVRTISGDDPQGDHCLKYVFSSEPESIPDTAEHRHFVRTGELFAADAKTAEKCGRSFLDPALALEHARASAAALHLAHTGEASAFLSAPAPKASEPAKAAPKPAAPAATDGGKS